VDHLYVDQHQTGARFFLHYADLTDASSLALCLAAIQPAPWLWKRRPGRRNQKKISPKVLAVLCTNLGIQPPKI
jgi:hypothetical protein